jgi:hypothetical protein
MEIIKRFQIFLKFRIQPPTDSVAFEIFTMAHRYFEKEAKLEKPLKLTPSPQSKLTP